MYAGRVGCWPLMSHCEYADSQRTDGWTDAASLISKKSKIFGAQPLLYVSSNYSGSLWIYTSAISLGPDLEKILGKILSLS